MIYGMGGHTVIGNISGYSVHDQGRTNCQKDASNVSCAKALP